MQRLHASTSVGFFLLQCHPTTPPPLNSSLEGNSFCPCFHPHAGGRLARLISYQEPLAYLTRCRGPFASSLIFLKVERPLLLTRRTTASVRCMPRKGVKSTVGGGPPGSASPRGCAVGTSTLALQQRSEESDGARGGARCAVRLRKVVATQPHQM